VQIKHENMERFIEAIRVELKDYFSKLYYSDDDLERMNDELLKSESFTDELLNRHEEMLEDLKYKYNESKELYEDMALWLKMWDDFIEFEITTDNPARLKQRGYSLLKESNQRKAFETKFPKIENQIKKASDDYKAINDQEFTVYGQIWSDFIRNKRREHEESKQTKRLESKILRDTQLKSDLKFGTKPSVPLTKKRRPQDETQMEIVGTPASKLRGPKRERFDNTMITSMASMTIKTPSTLKSCNKAKGTIGRNGFTNSGLSGAASSIASKLKYSSPARREQKEKRKSNRLANLAAAQKNKNEPSLLKTNDEIRKFTEPSHQDQDTTLKSTTISSIGNGTSYQSVINSTTTSSSSITTVSGAPSIPVFNSSYRPPPTSATKIQQFSSKHTRNPPPCQSARFASTHKYQNVALDMKPREASTASNTFIDEEECELVETTCVNQKSRLYSSSSNNNLTTITNGNLIQTAVMQIQNTMPPSSSVIRFSSFSF
jgi:hypothetical protein